MIQSYYSAKNAMKAQQTRLDTIANNISNINTVAFKNNAINFKDTLYTEMDNGLLRGTGVMIASATKSFTQGLPMVTGQSLDFMIDGNGFFTIQKNDGTLAYTRDGSFGISAEAQGNYLVTAQGYYVMDQNGQRIQLPNGTEDILVNGQGAIETKSGTPIAILNIASFDNEEGLSAMGDGCYGSTDVSGTAKKAQDYTVKNGFLEGSNVDLSQELVKLISTQRAYTLAGKALQTADEMHHMANNMRTS